ncbi:unnamed protein product [Pichia kudriavzevii]
MGIMYPRNRVLQRDAIELESQAESILETQLDKAFKDGTLPITIQRIGSRYGDDLKLLLKLILFKLFVWNSSTRYGLILQNLKIANTSGSRLNTWGKAVIFLGIVGSYLKGKLSMFVYSDLFESWEATHPKLHGLVRKLSKVVPFIVTFLNVSELINTVVFLMRGDYMRLWNRIFGIRYERANANAIAFASNPETLSYEFQNRQLLWNGIAEFLTNLSTIQLPEFVENAWNRAKKEDCDLSEFRSLPERCCVICYSEDQRSDKVVDDHLITNAYITECGHIYCYFCLVNAMRRRWNCLRCGKRVERIEIYMEGMDELKGDVEEYYERVRSGSETEYEEEATDDEGEEATDDEGEEATDEEEEEATDEEEEEATDDEGEEATDEEKGNCLNTSDGNTSDGEEQEGE